MMENVFMGNFTFSSEPFMNTSQNKSTFDLLWVLLWFKWAWLIWKEGLVIAVRNNLCCFLYNFCSHVDVEGTGSVGPQVTFKFSRRFFFLSYSLKHNEAKDVFFFFEKRMVFFAKDYARKKNFFQIWLFFLSTEVVLPESFFFLSEKSVCFVDLLFVSTPNSSKIKKKILSLFLLI